jgi:hypothetical protein
MADIISQFTKVMDDLGNITTFYGSGYSGTSGFSAYSGISGYSGVSGFSAYSGVSGYSAYSGVSGYSGRSGFSAYSGVSGYSGLSGESPGVSGFSGYSGFTGWSGTSGLPGGDSGYSGVSGYSGIYSNIFVITDATDTYTILNTDQTVICNKATPFTVTLPATTVGIMFYIANIGVGTATIDADSTDLINGYETISLGQWESIQIQCYVANNWILI